MTAAATYNAWIVGGPACFEITADTVEDACRLFRTLHGEWPDFVEPASIRRGDPRPPSRFRRLVAAVTRRSPA